MKNIYLFMVFVAIVSLATVSCNKNDCERCTITTEPCTGYAPDGIEISWTDYNTVEAVHAYFKHVYTAKEHKNDTVRLCGYIVGYNDTNYYRTQYENPYCGLVNVYITDNPEKQFMSSGGLCIPLVGKQEQMGWLLEYRAKQKVFVTSFCDATDPAGNLCNWVVTATADSVFIESTLL